MKKPFNPIIGETFACAWKHDDGSISQYLAEQVWDSLLWAPSSVPAVDSLLLSCCCRCCSCCCAQVSHRPPVTAMYFENRRNHVVMNAQVWTK